MEERFLDTEEVAGSSPAVNTGNTLSYYYARLVQLVRAPRLHRGSRGFESLSEHATGVVSFSNHERNLTLKNK